MGKKKTNDHAIQNKTISFTHFVINSMEVPKYIWFCIMDFFRCDNAFDYSNESSTYDECDIIFCLNIQSFLKLEFFNEEIRNKCVRIRNR